MQWSITETEGLTIETEAIGIVYSQGEEDTNTLEVYGTPDAHMEMKKPDTVGMTCGTIVNRIPDVINAEAGFVTTSKMPTLRYKEGDLGNTAKEGDQG